MAIASSLIARDRGMWWFNTITWSLIAFLYTASAKHPLQTLLSVLAIFSCLIVSTHLSVAVHELGHLIAGKCLGFKFYAMRIGPFYWWQSGKRLRFSFKHLERKSNGFVSMSPTDDVRLLSRFRWFIAGGPIASALLVMLLCFVVDWRELPRWIATFRVTPLEVVRNLCLFILGAVALVIFASAAIPFRFRGFYNDAAQLILSVFNPKNIEVRGLSLKWSAEVSSGVPCSEWDKDTLRKMVVLAKAPFEKALYELYLGDALLYSGHVEEGLASLERSYAALSKPLGIMPEYEAAIALDTAFARAYFGNDVAGGRLALEKADSLKPVSRYGVFRAQAAIALREGDLEAVLESATAGKAWLKENEDMERRSVQASVEEMDKLIAEAGFGDTPSPVEVLQI